MNKLPTELYKNVFDYLRPIDLMNVKKLDRFRNKLSNTEIDKRFINWDTLKEMFGNPKEFLQFANKDTLISGDIIVKFLLNETKLSNTMKIYTISTQFNKLQEFLIKQGYILSLVTETASDTGSDLSETGSESNFSEFDNDFDTLLHGGADSENEVDDPFAYLSDTDFQEVFIYGIFQFTKYDALHGKTNTITVFVSEKPKETLDQEAFMIFKNYYDGNQIYFSKELLNKTENVPYYDLWNMTYKNRLVMLDMINIGFKFEISKAS